MRRKVEADVQTTSSAHVHFVFCLGFIPSSSAIWLFDLFWLQIPVSSVLSIFYRCFPLKVSLIQITLTYKPYSFKTKFLFQLVIGFGQFNWWNINQIQFTIFKRNFLLFSFCCRHILGEDFQVDNKFSRFWPWLSWLRRCQFTGVQLSLFIFYPFYGFKFILGGDNNHYHAVLIIYKPHCYSLYH